MSIDFEEARENIRAASRTLRAYMRFEDEVAAVMLDLAEQGDEAALRLIGPLRDLHVRTGEYVINEEERTG